MPARFSFFWNIKVCLTVFVSLKTFSWWNSNIVDNSKWHKYWAFSKFPSTAGKIQINSMIMLIINYLEMSERKQKSFDFGSQIFEYTLEYGMEILWSLVVSKGMISSTISVASRDIMYYYIINLEQRCKLFSDYFMEFILFPILNNTEWYISYLQHKYHLFLSRSNSVWMKNILVLAVLFYSSVNNKTSTNVSSIDLELLNSAEN